MVDLFKPESPVNANMINSLGNVQELFYEMGRLAGRPWVMLSAGAEKENFQNILLHAFQAGASGFLAGRAIWQASFLAYPNWQKSLMVFPQMVFIPPENFKNSGQKCVALDVPPVLRTPRCYLEPSRLFI